MSKDSFEQIPTLSYKERGIVRKKRRKLMCYLARTNPRIYSRKKSQRVSDIHPYYCGFSSNPFSFDVDRLEQLRISPSPLLPPPPQYISYSPRVVTPKLKRRRKKKIQKFGKALARVTKTRGRRRRGPSCSFFSGKVCYGTEQTAKMHFIHRRSGKKEALQKRGFLSWRRGLIEKSFPDSPQFPLKREAAPRLKKPLPGA